MKNITPTARQLYFTSDGLAFFDRVQAAAYAETLTDKQVSSKTNDEIEREVQACIEEGAGHFQDLLCNAEDMAA